MIELTKEQMKCLDDLYLNCNDSTVWSCLQGYMGRAWVDQYPNPTVARIIQGDFCFPAGEAGSIEADKILEEYPIEINPKDLLIIPHSIEWNNKLLNSDYYQKVTRYSILKEGFNFSVDRLQSFINELPKEYTLRQIDKELYYLALSEEWSKDFCSNFKSVEEYVDLGLGFVILHNGKIICGASSYTIYQDGIEIEIGTRTEYRRQGLATICGARLILECMKQNKYPNWDAANLNSVKVAEKLGYHFDREYVTYKHSEISNELG